MKLRAFLIAFAAPLLVLTQVSCPAKGPAIRGPEAVKSTPVDPAQARLETAERLLRQVPRGSSGLLVLDWRKLYRLWDDLSRLAGRTELGSRYLGELRKLVAKEGKPMPWSVADLQRMGLDPDGPALVHGRKRPIVILPVADAAQLRTHLARLVNRKPDAWRQRTVAGKTVQTLDDMHCHQAGKVMTCCSEPELAGVLAGTPPRRSAWDEFAPPERADLRHATVAYFTDLDDFTTQGSATVEDDGVSARLRGSGGKWNEIAAYYKGLGKRHIIGLAGGAASTIYARFDLAPLLRGKEHQLGPLKALGLDPERLMRELTGEVMLVERDGEIALMLGCRDPKLSHLLTAVLATVIQREAAKKRSRARHSFTIRTVPGSGGADYHVTLKSTDPMRPLQFTGRLRAGKAGVVIGNEKLALALTDAAPPSARSYVKTLPSAVAREAFGPRAIMGFLAGLADPVEVLAKRHPKMLASMRNMEPKFKPMLGLGRLALDQLHNVSFGAVRDKHPGLRIVARVSTLHSHGVAGDDAARDLWIKGVKAKLTGDEAVYRETLDVLAGKHHGSRYGKLKEARLGGKGAVAATMGILAAVAIPAFVKYIRKSKTVEAVEALHKINLGAKQYYLTDHYDRSGNLMKKAFPPSAPLTPAKVPCKKVTTPASAWKAWEGLHFALTEPHYYAYAFTSAGTGVDATFTARAHGDLDCDGVLSTYEIRGSVNKEGDVKVLGPIITNEIE